MPGLYGQRRGLSIEYWRPNLYCCICGERITIFQEFNKDHLVPVSLGGKGGYNKRYAHYLCNQVKGNRHPFSLMTPAQREAAREWIPPRTYKRLLHIWRGGHE